MRIELAPMRIPNDNYPTPEPLAEWIVDRVLDMHPRPFSEISMIEPACGDTAPFARAAIRAGVESVYATDIRSVVDSVRSLDKGDMLQIADRTDFLDTDAYNNTNCPESTFQAIVTNPPYRLALPFVEQCLDLLSSDGIATFLLRLGFLATLSRRELYDRRPPYEIIVLQRRPSFTGKGTDGTEYGFFIWLGKRLKRFSSKAPRISWFENPKTD